jgi:hypothetical protein
VTPEAFSGDDHDVGSTTHPKTDVVVAVVGIVVVAVGGAAVPRIVVPAPAAQHAVHIPGSPAGEKPASTLCRPTTTNANNRERRYAALSVFRKSV